MLENKNHFKFSRQIFFFVVVVIVILILTKAFFKIDETF